MRELNQKIKRVQPMIKVRKRQLDLEALELKQIRDQKLSLIQQLKYFETEYIKGIECLNIERQSINRERLQTMESSVDVCKSKWYSFLKQVKESELKEKAQIAQYMQAERELKSMEKLEERYETERNSITQKAEQKALDETALRQRYNNS